MLHELFPRTNFRAGLVSVEITELDEPIHGKVRDMWIVGDKRVIVTTDRQSAFDRLICTIPGKGRVLNELSGFWFEKTKDIVPNHMISIPHSNVLIARNAKETLPVEVVLRRYMARSTTPTSIYQNYHEGQRKIYGIDFPDNLWPNQEFPMGTIITPTTKEEEGHDKMLTDKQAEKLVGKKLWEKIKSAALTLFEEARQFHIKRGFILADSKLEFGIDDRGELMIIDELFTPDSSRLWLGRTYSERFKHAQYPDTFDKEILRRWLSRSENFTGEGPVPSVPQLVIERMARAYSGPLLAITGRKTPYEQRDPDEIRQAVLDYFALQ